MYRTLALFSLLVISLGFASAATVTGKVVGEDGKPINGAKLVLHRFDDGSTQSLVADAAGSFAIEVDLDLLPPNFLIGNIIACAPGYTLVGTMLKEHDTVITLGTGSSLCGTVADARGKPLAGIPVRLFSLQHNNDYAQVPDEWRDRFTVTSAADGTWTLPGIPPEGTVSIALADDRYVHEQRDITLVKGEKAIPVSFTVRPGAVLTGRVLTPEGKPATDTGVSITSANGHGAGSETAVDGRYRFPGLATGTYTIYAYSKKQAWPKPLKDIALVEGKETTAADLRINAGAMLEGTLQDAETGAPIAGWATVILYTGNSRNKDARRNRITADKQGHFHLCIQPGQMKLRIDNPPRGYLKQQDTDALPVDLRDGKTVTVLLKLHKGLTVSGTVTDGEGKPAAGVHFFIHMPSGNGDIWSPNDTQVQFTTDGNGHFEAGGLPAGKGTLNLYTEYQQISTWEQSAPQPIDMPANAPIAVTVTRVVMHSVTGRVLDTKQQPLAGVTATCIVMFSQGMGPQKMTATTDKDGCYQLANIPAKITVNLVSLEKKGYRQLLASTLTSTGNGTIDDAVMTACDATVRGKVCDAAGKPVQGATLVSVEGGLAVRATTDDTGAFTLPEQPEGELHLIAATPTGGGLATCKAGDTNVTLSCTPALVAKPVDIPLARQLLDADSKLPKEQREFNRADTLREIADRDFALASKLALSDEESLSDGLRANLLGKLAEQNPAKIPEALTQLNLFQDPDCKLYAAVELGIAVAKTEPDLAEQLYQIAKPIYDRCTHGPRNGFRPIEGLGTFADVSLRTIALAGLLNKTADVDAMLAPLNVLAKQDPGMSYMITQPLFAAAGRVSPEFVFKVYQSIDTPFKIGDLREAVASMAEQDPAAAQRLINMIDAMPAEGTAPTDLGPVITALGKKDPAAALALAKASSYNQQPGLLLAAAAFQPKAAADAIILEVFSQERNRTIVNFAQANAVDAEIGKELYAKYKTKLEAQSYDFTHSGVMDALTNADRIKYAYLISSVDPVEARLIIETEYAGAVARTRHGERVFALQFFPQAMCALDVARAQAMFDAANALGTDFRTFLRQRLMQYILMSREERVGSTYF